MAEVTIKLPDSSVLDEFYEAQEGKQTRYDLSWNAETDGHDANLHVELGIAEWNEAQTAATVDTVDVEIEAPLVTNEDGVICYDFSDVNIINKSLITALDEEIVHLNSRISSHESRIAKATLRKRVGIAIMSLGFVGTSFFVTKSFLESADEAKRDDYVGDALASMSTAWIGAVVFSRSAGVRYGLEHKNQRLELINGAKTYLEANPIGVSQPQ